MRNLIRNVWSGDGFGPGVRKDRFRRSARKVHASGISKRCYAQRHRGTGTDRCSPRPRPSSVSASICPILVPTPFAQQTIGERAVQSRLWKNAASRALLQKNHPSGRFAIVEDITALVLFLRTDNISNFTWASFPIDHGWTGQ